ncbi:MAG: hypothetical protein K0Q43_20 [Ramlibacter sp.]|jgi:hypothetical protein|nr:hypothetical protein [Ramlibacter sp.]
MRDVNEAPQQEAAAWLHEDGSRSITAAEKKSMLENQGVPGKRVAALYNIPLVRAKGTPPAAAPDVALPSTPLPVVRHPQLGELFDRFQLHQFAVRYADLTWAAAQSPGGARAIVFQLGEGPEGVRIELARQKDGAEMWAVRDRVGNCLRLDGDWEIEPSPSSRDGEFLGRTRFPAVDGAIAAAAAAVGRTGT